MAAHNSSERRSSGDRVAIEQTDLAGDGQDLKEHRMEVQQGAVSASRLLERLLCCASSCGHADMVRKRRLGLGGP
jgi:hypothetical protein